MMTRLTRREMALIFIAGCMLVCSAGYYLLASPVRSEALEKEILLQAARMEAERVRMEAATSGEMEKRLAEAEMESMENQEEYGFLLSSSRLELKILDLLEEYRLMPKQTVITNPVPVLKTNQEQKDGSQIYKGSIYVTAAGKRVDFYRFLNRMEEITFLRVSEFWMEEIPEQTEHEILADIKIECYMVMPDSPAYEEDKGEP